MKTFLVAVVLALGFAAPAVASLHENAHIDSVTSDVAGFPVTAYGEDDFALWPNLAWNGYTRIDQPIIYLSPSTWDLLTQIETDGLSNHTGLFDTEAVLTLVHEAEHQRLHSLDEARVQACAVSVFPDVITRDYGITKTVVVNVKHVSYTTKRVRVHHKIVKRKVPVVTFTQETQDNPAYVSLLRNVRSLYETESPPYSGGTCY